MLRSMFASLALPYMPSLAWAQGERSVDGMAPRRFVSMVVGDGMHPSGWTASQGSGGLILKDSLAPLKNLGKQISLVQGLGHSREMKRVHGFHFTTFLNCSYADSESIKSNVSIDQMIAKQIGRNTAIPSLVMGVEPTRPGIVNGAQAIYQATNSWSSDTTPVPPEVIPQQAFNRLFDSSGQLSDKSILDYVLDSSKSVRRKVNYDDRDKLDEYLTSVRELEQRIEKNGMSYASGWTPSLQQPNMKTPASGIPEDKDTHMKLMLDILLLALQMDKTRVVNFILGQDFSNKTYEFLDDVSKSGLHSLSHYKKTPGALEQYKRVNHYHMENVAYLTEKMNAIDEGNGTTLLDNTLVMFGSCYMDGNSHDRDGVPIAFIGGRSHGLNQGKIFEFNKSDDKPLGNLYVTLAQRMGMNAQTIGNGTRPLGGIFRA